MASILSRPQRVKNIESKCVSDKPKLAKHNTGGWLQYWSCVLRLQVLDSYFIDQVG